MRKKFFILIALFAAMPIAIWGQEQKKQDIKTVAVYMLGNPDGGRSIVNNVTRAFSYSPKYRAVERTEAMNNVLTKERNFQLSGEVSDDQMAEAGKALGADFVCAVGYFNEEGQKYLSVRLINTSNRDIKGPEQVYWPIDKTTAEMKAIKVDEAMKLLLGADYNSKSPSSGTPDYNAQQSRVPVGYVDLGLPSRTLWKATNESGLYDYSDAVGSFGSKLPTQAQFQELKDYCTWNKTNSGYKVIGPNDKFIILPASGYCDCDYNVKEVGVSGYYWSSTSGGYYNAWTLYFQGYSVGLGNYGKCNGRSVRLVINP